jgi:hypothetical protein
MAAALPEQKDYRFIFENLICSRETQNCMLYRCSNCQGQSQLQTVTKELLNLPNSRSGNNPSLYSKITSFIFEDVERNLCIRN